MKKIRMTIVLVLFMASSLSLQALEFSEYKIAVKGGYNLAQHYGTLDQSEGYKVGLGFHHGFTAGASLELPITRDFSFRYELNYVTKGSREKITISEIEGEPLVKPAVMNVEYKLGYVEFPMLFKLKAVKGKNFSVAITAGAVMALKTNGRYNLDGVIYFPEADTFSIINLVDSSNLKGINQFDYSLIYGGELDITVAKRPYTIGYSFTIGWDYLSLPTYDAAGSEPVQLRNQSYALYLSTPLWHHRK